MLKTCSIVFTVGWAMAVVFGYLALSAPPGASAGLQVLNTLLAFAGAMLGLFAWSRILRGC